VGVVKNPSTPLHQPKIKIKIKIKTENQDQSQSQKSENIVKIKIKVKFQTIAGTGGNKTRGLDRAVVQVQQKAGAKPAGGKEDR
jgi:hypothetical protein